MYKVILNSEKESISLSKSFTEYSHARNYANRLFHKRYTLSIRQQGFPADDCIVFNKPDFIETEEIIVYNRQEAFSLLIIKADNNTSSKLSSKFESSTKTNLTHMDHSHSATNTTSSNQQSTDDTNIYSIKDHVDSIYLRQRLMTNMLESTPVCPACGEILTSRNNTTIKKIDNRIGFTRKNCFLKHRQCQTNAIRTSIQFIYSD